MNISYDDQYSSFDTNEGFPTSFNDIIIYDNNDVYAIFGKFFADNMISVGDRHMRRKFICESWSNELWNDEDDEDDDFSSSIENVKSIFFDESEYRIRRIFIQKSAWNRLSKKKRFKLLNLGSRIRNIYIFENISSIPFNFFINLH